VFAPIKTESPISIILEVSLVEFSIYALSKIKVFLPIQTCAVSPLTIVPCQSELPSFISTSPITVAF